MTKIKKNLMGYFANSLRSNLDPEVFASGIQSNDSIKYKKIYCKNSIFFTNYFDYYYNTGIFYINIKFYKMWKPKDLQMIQQFYCKFISNFGNILVYIKIKKAFD